MQRTCDDVHFVEIDERGFGHRLKTNPQAPYDDFKKICLNISESYFSIRKNRIFFEQVLLNTFSLEQMKQILETQRSRESIIQWEWSEARTLIHTYLYGSLVGLTTSYTKEQLNVIKTANMICIAKQQNQ